MKPGFSSKATWLLAFTGGLETNRALGAGRSNRYDYLPRSNVKRSGPATFDGHGDRSPQKRHRNDEAVLFRRSDQDSFQAGKGAIVETHLLSDLQKWPGFRYQSGPDCCLDHGNFRVLNGGWDLANAYEMQHARDG